MKTATAKDLRQKTAAVLEEIRKGQKVTITYRGKSIAILSPVATEEKKKKIDPVGFGMWQSRKDLKDVEKWLKNIRKSRHRELFSIRTS
ncbi:MAG: type II toxin-antitoxin system prevent-host-death family antitoxin [Nitrospirae bacterium]|nr:type II toxin-antitoxin system prevent-host-death family antitoxin [Nitrospirota bacterium]MBI3351301.1 type II toxin-antitoxin system prevent-host-death family antitoxin [Nitrospirota bacterium]